ncbi:MAG: cysteinyl-tRNA synthetase [Candidatus Peribacteria bacterium]|nr:cysteinyl-tRNA synthetase [Candidatus Peribacteria bacterium]
MSLILYNSLTKREEPFEPREPGHVTMYTCGPTVYGQQHIGNYSAFLMADLLRRWLEVSGYAVKHAKNITDVGHLVADQDTGEDKIEKQAREEKADPLTIAKKYTDLYIADEKMLNLLEPFARPRATETIKEMIQIIGVLLERGHAYETGDGIYFSVETFPEYGKLSGNKISDLNAGARVDVKEEKKHPADFALWKKTVGENSHHLLRWNFSNGERSSTTGDDAASGFPGWHIECSAMSKKFLGEQIDIHTGGEDNIFPHHECEIAQSECSGPAPFVRYWLHKRRIEIALDGEESLKMSKSLGNVLTIPDFIERGYDPMDVRYYLLSVHYRTNLKFSWKGLDDARKARRKIVEWISECIAPKKNEENNRQSAVKMRDAVSASGKNISPDALLETAIKIENISTAFDAAMNNDLNTSAAIAAIFSMMSLTRTEDVKNTEESLVAFIEKIQYTFGCFDASKVEEELPSEVQLFVDARSRARADKNFTESDRLRGEIEKHGYTVKDTSEGQIVRKSS